MSVEVVAKNTCKEVGEGPHWDEENQCVLYVDIGSGDVHKWHYASGKDEKQHISDNPVGMIVPNTKGGYVISQMNKVAQYDWESNSVKVLHEVEKGMNHRFNDGKCDASGRFWLGTMPLVTPGKNAFQLPKEESCLYSLETDGRLVKRLEGVSLSNGLGWSPDNKTMYFIDTPLVTVDAFDFDIASGNMSNRRTVYKWDNLLVDGIRCFPDGMTVDAEGKLWVAVYNSGKVYRIDPETGKEMTTITLPGQMETTSCCFGGKDYSELFVTCKFVPGKREAQPNSGSLFKVSGLGVKGMPAHKYGS